MSLSRRGFLKGLAATAAGILVPGAPWATVAADPERRVWALDRSMPRSLPAGSFETGRIDVRPIGFDRLFAHADVGGQRVPITAADLETALRELWESVRPTKPYALFGVDPPHEFYGIHWLEDA